MKNAPKFLLATVLLAAFCAPACGQDTAKQTEKQYKNVIRYNLSGALLFGINRYIVLGYERVVNPHQSFSVNVGVIGLPKFLSISTDSLDLSKDTKNNGYNISADYRFYLAKENKYLAPHGVYIGPYTSYNRFDRKNDWEYKQNSGNQKVVTTETTLDYFTIGGEMGYQFILWKRFAIDLIMMGPGVSHYQLHATVQSGLSQSEHEQLLSALEQLLTQKFPGMNYTFSGKTFDANGKILSWNVGFRYIVHIGFVF